MFAITLFLPCHFEDILAEMNRIFAALTAGNPLFGQDGDSGGRDAKA